jgi:hypothetical protein
MKTKMCHKCKKIKEKSTFQSKFKEETLNCDQCRRIQNEKQKNYFCECGRSLHYSNYIRHVKSRHHQHYKIEDQQSSPTLTIKNSTKNIH